MSNAACEAVIHEYCHELKLAAVVRDYPGLCRHARDGGWAYEDRGRTGPSGAVESPLDSETGLELCVCKPPGVGGSLNQDLWKSR
jgi:hypothetical protein